MRAFLPALFLGFGLSAPLPAQSLEPRAYSPAPVGMNFAVVGTAFTSGALAEDPATPLTDPEIETRGVVLGYVRTFDAGGKLGRVEVVLPVSGLEGRALFDGQPVERQVSGIGDPTFRLSAILVGVPAMDAREFRSFRQDWLIGTSVLVQIPIGQYDPDRLVNLGTNRWTVRPEVAVSRAFGRFVLEGTAALSLYSDNRDFFGGQTRTQAPLISARMHGSYSFPRGGWVSLDSTYFTGGRSAIDGVPRNDSNANWRTGMTVTLPVTRALSLRFYGSRGLTPRTGQNFDLAGAAIQFRWLDRREARRLAASDPLLLGL
jgi:hypothetical protein